MVRRARCGHTNLGRSNSRINIGDNMVPEEGVEPTRPEERQILSLLRLPVPPLRENCKENIMTECLGKVAGRGYPLEIARRLTVTASVARRGVAPLHPSRYGRTS